MAFTTVSIQPTPLANETCHIPKSCKLSVIRTYSDGHPKTHDARTQKLAKAGIYAFIELSGLRIGNAYSV